MNKISFLICCLFFSIFVNAGSSQLTIKHHEIIEEIKNFGVNENLLKELSELCKKRDLGAYYTLIINDKEDMSFENRYKSFEKLCNKNFNYACLSLYRLLANKSLEETHYDMSESLRKKIIIQNKRFKKLCIKPEALECIYTKSLEFILSNH